MTSLVQKKKLGRRESLDTSIVGCSRRKSSRGCEVVSKMGLRYERCRAMLGIVKSVAKVNGINLRSIGSRVTSTMNLNSVTLTDVASARLCYLFIHLCNVVTLLNASRASWLTSTVVPIYLVKLSAILTS